MEQTGGHHSLRSKYRVFVGALSGFFFSSWGGCCASRFALQEKKREEGPKPVLQLKAAVELISYKLFRKRRVFSDSARKNSLVRVLCCKKLRGAICSERATCPTPKKKVAGLPPPSRFTRVLVAQTGKTEKSSRSLHQGRRAAIQQQNFQSSIVWYISFRLLLLFFSSFFFGGTRRRSEQELLHHNKHGA